MPRPALPAVRLLAAGAVVAALFSASPAILEIAAAWRETQPPLGFTPARWAIVLGWVGMLQAAYGCYLWLWNDAASARVVALMLGTLAGVYAAALAVILFANPRGWLLGSGGMQLAAELPGGRAALWCLCLISLCACLAYFAARQSLAWRAT